MEGTRTLPHNCNKHCVLLIEIREPRGGDENAYFAPNISDMFIEIREPRGGDENLIRAVPLSDFRVLR